MTAESDNLTTFVSRVRLVGYMGEDAVKTLPGFKKGRHAVPDAVTPATRSFFARLCQDMVAEEAEAWFQRARAELSYKRKELTLEVASPLAVLTATDFTFELEYRLLERDAGRFAGVRTLHDLKEGRLGVPTFEALFAGQFTEIAFDLKKGVQVEAVIDAVEELESAGGLRVDYPSDYRECTLSVAGVEAEVLCDGSSLAMSFPRAGAPMELVEGFCAVRRAFVLSEREELAGLL
ncbi:hypothetical protein [Synoicihabitans lomoniglobus]|uniref:Uncharacterized protein n=1 Tax=Synoicihabitans lomoniglobus TaxID=2909285 RepID=A0AAF0CP15_9BACT|nr:hypothetical protein [Opitutaceae bacterium LMO-M01]WED65421.1 hypothetical protein PXH66_00980 [Opitutaceae bacterium LMO-M01]